MGGTIGKIRTEKPRASSPKTQLQLSPVDNVLSPKVSVACPSPAESSHKTDIAPGTDKPLNLSDHDLEGKPITNTGNKKKGSMDQSMNDFAFDLENPTAGTNLGAFPSMDNLSIHYNKIFDIIESKDYNGVERFLEEQGQKVDIIPKRGCSELHYTKLNVANNEDDYGNSPLIKAAQIDSTMVRIILKYGGNPNHTNEERDSPLSIAAVRGDRESIDILLLAGANLTAAVVKLTSYLRYQTEVHDDNTMSGFESGFSVKSLTFLLSNDVYLKCRDPIKAAFDVSRDIERIVDVRDEFKMEFELLIRDADVFAYKILDHCEKMWEAREVLDRANGLLSRAIDEGKKRFVAHPFSQMIILEDWYGKVAFKMKFGKLKIAIRYLMSPVLLPLYFLHFLCLEKCWRVSMMNSRVAEHMKLLFIPFMCFVTDVINYFILLGLLIATCVVNKSSNTPHWVEIALWVCIASRLLIELDQMTQQGLWRYLPNIWNVLELTSSLVITAAALYRITIWKTYDNPTNDINKSNKLHQDILSITYLYAITEFFMFLRWLNFLEFFPSLGPLLIALRHLITDVFKFVIVVLLTCVIGSAIAVYAITNTINLHVAGQTPGVGVKAVPDEFKDLKSCFKNIMWSTFGLLEMPDIYVTNDETSTNVIIIILVLYILMAVVLMMNMLIALLNNTFERIQDNCDIEWKYARSEQLKEYRNGQPFLFPFHFFLIPLTYWFRSKIEEERLSTKRMTQPDLLSHMSDDREKLLNTLCDRYSRSHDTDSVSELMFNYRRSETFSEAAALQRHRRREKTHTKTKRMETLKENDTDITRYSTFHTIRECATSTATVAS